MSDSNTKHTPISREEIQSRLWDLTGLVYDELGYSKRRDAVAFIERTIVEKLREVGTIDFKDKAE